MLEKPGSPAVAHTSRTSTSNGAWAKAVVALTWNEIRTPCAARAVKRPSGWAHSANLSITDLERVGGTAKLVSPSTITDHRTYDPPKATVLIAFHDFPLHAFPVFLIAGHSPSPPVGLVSGRSSLPGGPTRPPDYMSTLPPCPTARVLFTGTPKRAARCRFGAHWDLRLRPRWSPFPVRADRETLACRSRVPARRAAHA